MADNNDSLLAKLDEIEARFNEIEQQISDPEVPEVWPPPIFRGLR